MSWKKRIDKVLDSGRYRPNEYPRTWLFSDDPVRYRGGTLYVASAPADATLILRRSPAAQQYRDVHWNKKRDSPLNVPPLELELAQPLPDLCPTHGRAAVSRLLVRSNFYETRAHPRNPHGGNQLGRRVAPVSTIVVGKWPLCDRCRRRLQWYHAAAGILVLLMALNLIVLIAVGLMGNYEPLIVPMVVGVFPGSLPIGTVLALVLFDRGNPRVMLRPIDDERTLSVDAHPDFTAALHQMRPSPEQLPPPDHRQ